VSLTHAGALLVLLVLGSGLVACGQPIDITRPRGASPTAAPVAGRGGIASGAAVGNAPGLAPPAPPPPEAVADRIASVAGDCTPTHPIKAARDHRAYEPSRADYIAVQATACYTTLAAAATDGYQPADELAGAPQPAPSATAAP
jgi:hypothetical protein